MNLPAIKPSPSAEPTPTPHKELTAYFPLPTSNPPPLPPEIWHQIILHLHDSPLKSILDLRTVSSVLCTAATELLVQSISSIILLLQDHPRAPTLTVIESFCIETMRETEAKEYAPRFIRSATSSSQTASPSGSLEAEKKLTLFVSESFSNYPVTRGDRLFYTHHVIQKSLSKAVNAVFNGTTDEGEEKIAVECLFNFKTTWRRGILPVSVTYDAQREQLSVDVAVMIRENLARGSRGENVEGPA